MSTIDKVGSRSMMNYSTIELMGAGEPEQPLSSATPPPPPAPPSSSSPLAAPTSPPLPCQEDIEKWATHLVGRWWEIFWDPEPDTSSPKNETAPSAPVVKNGSVDERNNIGSSDSDGLTQPAVFHQQQQQQQQQQQHNQQQQQHNQFQANSSAQHASIHQPVQIPRPVQQQQQLLQQHSQHLHQQQQQQQNSRRYEVLCTTPSIGLSLSLSSTLQIIVTSVAPPSTSNNTNYSMIRPRDVLVGVNGKTFQELMQTNKTMSSGKGPLHFVVEYLRSIDRPMVVMFERGVDATAATIPASASTMGVKDNANGANNNNDDDESDDDKEADIDWYDAKVLSFNAETNTFTVLFLGDDEDVTYEMALQPKLVRPSVRVWTRRALSLIYLDEKLVSSMGGLADGGNCDTAETIECRLPPSTDLPEDSKQLGILSQVENKVSGIGSARYRKLVEYSQLLEKQQYLATRLSPLIHEDDEDDDDGSDGAGQDHPGPLADSNYVEHLCNCMKEIKASCDWMICESAVLDILRKISLNDVHSATAAPKADFMRETVVSTEPDFTTKVSREVILHFLVNGSRFLNRLLSFDPESRASASSQSTRQGGGHRGRKKRRIGDSPIRTNHYVTRSRVHFDSIFDNMLTRALLSNESLYSLVHQLLNNSSIPNKLDRVWIIRTLVHSLSTLLTNLWTPVTNWISKSEDMINGASGQFYTIEDVESHAQYAEGKGTSLGLIHLTDWTTELVTKLNRARHFEVEVLNAIGACTQPVGATNNVSCIQGKNTDGSTEVDDCILTLQRLQDEAMRATSASTGAIVDFPMRNINPLGRSLVNYNSGMVLPSPLTRGVINDAITVRRWVLDLCHANAVRERTSFVQNVITRYQALPQLPTLPILTSGGAFANPSVMLENNTRDLMAILSSNCYSYNHIIMDISARLQGSMSGDGDVLLRHKEEVMKALATLARLPILSIVEEELNVRDELIDWNEDAQRVMEMSDESKLPFNQVEALDRRLSDILALKSDRRAKLCHRLRSDRLVDEQIQAFAFADQLVVCPTTGSWVRDQHKRGSEWMMNYRSIIAALVDAATNTTRNKECVEVSRITALLEEHDLRLAVTFPEEYGQLHSAKQNVEQWTQSISKIVLSDSISLEERCQQLSDAARLRPKGVLVDPAGDVVDLWVRVFSWRLSLNIGVKTMLDHFGRWKDNQTPDHQMTFLDNQDMLRTLLTVFAPLIIEGQDLLISDEDVSRPFLKYLRSQSIRMLQAGDRSVFSKRTILESSAFGMSVLERVLESNSEQLLDSCLLFSRRVFWILMLKGFFSGLESDTFPGDMSDAKALLLLSNGDFPSGSILDTQAHVAHLQTLIGIAESINRKAFSILEKSNSLLQTNCDAHTEELREGLVVLCDIQSSLNSSELSLAVKLLPDKLLPEKIHWRIKWLTWLLNTFTYDIFNEKATTETTASKRIHVNNLRDLHDAIPNRIDQGRKAVIENFDREIVRVSTMVKDLWERANEWRTNGAELFPTLFGSYSLDNERNDEIVNVEDLVALAESPILCKVVMPELEAVQRVTEIARQVQRRLKKELFAEEYIGAVDVNQAHLPDRKSLIASNGDFVLLRFTGSEMYGWLRQSLHSLAETSAQLPVVTYEKSTLHWMVRVLDWVGSIRLVENSLGQLVINAEQAFEVLEQGHNIFYSVADEVQTYLRGEHVGLEVLPHGIKVSAMANELDSLGMGLLRWASFLFECLKSDVEKEDRWKDHALGAVKSFLKFESETIGGTISGFKDALQFSDYVESLVAFSSTLIIQDADISYSLSLLQEKMKSNVLFQKSVIIERHAMEERKFMLEKQRFTNPRNIVHDRYELLNSLLGRLNQLPDEDDNDMFRCIDDESLFDGDPSVRDKSRVFLEQCLWKGLETLGFVAKETDAQDFCSILAWDLEDAVHMKCQKDNSDIVSSEYRDKIRSLRFNLQDPKNPMLCAQVLAGEMSIQELVTASTEELASVELKLKRRQVEEEALKNVVLSVDIEKKILPKLGISLEVDNVGAVPCPSNGGNANASPSQSASLQHGTNQILASIPPPPLRVKHKSHESAVTFRSSPTQFDSPPPSPLLSSPEHTTTSISTEYILSQTGTDLFQITISKLKRTFIAKLAVDQTFEFDVDRFLPSDLVEKGRLSIDEFNKFIYQKTRDGRWCLAYLRLASIAGDSDTNCYKRFYKEYESLGRLAMIQVSDTTKVFLVTPKFLRVCKCLKNVENLNTSSTYAVVLHKNEPPQEQTIDVDDDMF